MEKINSFIFYIIIKVYLADTVNSPIKLNEKKYPFVLPDSNDSYYYVITGKYNLKIDKESGKTNNYENDNSKTVDYSKKTVFCTDNFNLNYLYYSNDFYNFDTNLLSLKKETISKDSEADDADYIGCIPQSNDFILYGFHSDHLYFSSYSQYDTYKYDYKDINEKMSCKFIEDEEFICALIIGDYIKIIFLKYRINSNDKNVHLINSIQIDKNIKYENIALYDTNNTSTIKLLCKKKRMMEKK